MERAQIKIERHGVSRDSEDDLFEKVDRLEPSQRQLCLAEAATRTFMSFLLTRHPLYPDFEEIVWQQFLSSKDLKDEIESLLTAQKHFIAVPNKYYDFVRGMFERSRKSRHEFYDDILSEARAEVDSEDISFGAAAMTFKKRTATSVHQENLLVFYSVELLIRAHATAHPRGSPISDARLETFYKHFEAAIPLAAKFEKYAKDDSLFLYSARHWLLPSIDGWFKN